MQEVEAKFYVMDLSKIEAHLRELEAQLIQPRVLETNLRFDLPNGRLRSERRVLRLRRDTEARLTYKDPSKNEQGVLSRREIEFIVEDIDKAKDFLEALGYHPIFYYEKYRTIYSLHPPKSFAKHPRNAVEGVEPSGGFIHVMLDELPYGNFVEIEGETVAQIQEIANKLNLKWETAIGRSYNALFERLCNTRSRLDRTKLTFDALHGLNIKAEELSIRTADL